jgi:hypothetical protein
MTSPMVDRRPRAKLASALSTIVVGVVFVIVVVDNADCASSLVPRGASFVPPPSKRIVARCPREGAVATTIIATPSSRRRPRDVVPRLARSPHGRGYSIHQGDNDDRDECDDGDGDSDDSGPSDAYLLNELRNARRDMFGTDVPSNDDLRAAARNSECEFLDAMRTQTEIFHRMKDDVGSDGACEAFMERIREADENVATVDDDNENDDGGGGGGGGGRSLIRRMMNRKDDDDDVAFGGPPDGITSLDTVDSSWQ